MSAHTIKDFELETNILAACLSSDEFLACAVDKLKPEHFAESGHPMIWEAIVKAYNSGNDVNVINIRAAFNSDATKEYVSALGDMSFAFKFSEPDPFVNKLINLYHLRELKWKLTDNLIDLEREDIGKVDAEELRAGLEKFLFEMGAGIAEDGPSLEGRQKALQEIEAVYKAGRIAGASTGFPSIDKIIGGMGNSDLIILAGRPGMGKTSLAVNIAEHIAGQGENILFCSLEMSKEQIEKRRLSTLTGIQVATMRQGPITAEQARTLFAVPSEQHFWIDDTAGISADQVLSRARRLQRTHGLKLLVVDYLQLMSASSTARRQGSVQATTEISKALKCIAKDLKIPVLALSQLSRALEQREDKRPQLSDLRESGSIEQDADIVLFTYREEYYLQKVNTEQRDKEGDESYTKRLIAHQERLAKCAGRSEVIVSKNRHGPSGTAYLRFIGETTKFEELTYE